MATLTGVLLALGGLAFSIAQWIEPTLQGPSFRPWMLWAPGLGLLFYSCFAAWRDEHSVRVDLETKAKNTRPDFTSFINWMVFEDPIDGFCTTYLLVNVKNIGGQASILDQWQVYVKTPDTLDREVRVVLPDGDCTLTTDASGNEAVIGSADFIQRKTFRTRIESGAGAMGVISALVPADLPDGRTLVAVTFRDVHQRQYRCEYDTAERKARGNDVRQIGNWPGVEIKHGRVILH